MIIHAALSVDVDRFTDAKLRKEWCPMVRINGVEPSPQALREACAHARAKGLDVFPPCNDVDERGMCRGHKEARP